MFIEHFSHKDLDGSGCVVALRCANFEVDNIEVQHCEVDESDDKINAFLDKVDISRYQAIYITDIPINEKTAERLNELCPNIVKLFDHHKTALWLNKYSWAHVVVSNDLGLCSGTSLFYEYFDSLGMYKYLPDQVRISHFIELVRRWDTFEWEKIYNDIDARRMNNLKNIYKVTFEDMFVEKIKSDVPLFSEQDMFLILPEEERNNKYMDSKCLEVIMKDFKGWKLGVVFADRCLSELGNKICKKYTEVDFAVMIDPSRSMSIRTVKDIDCTELATMFKGGGHKFAAGCPYPENLKQQIIDMTFKE